MTAIKDASDFLAAGGTADQLVAMAEAAPEWDPFENGSLNHAEASPVPATITPTRLTDAGNAARIVTRNGHELRHCSALGKWFHYDGKRWRFDDDGYVIRCAKKSAAEMFKELAAADPDQRAKLFKHASNSESAKGIRDALKLAECELAVKPDQLDADDFALGVENGVVDLCTGKIRPHRPEDLITKISPIVFNPSATCSIWITFLHRIMGGNVNLIGYLQRLAGLCATGDASIQELFIAYGGGANGKSVFFDTLSYVLADHAGIAPDSLLISRRGGNEHPTELASTFGKRVVFASETEDGGKLRLQLVKKMTGDEKLTGRYMRQDYIVVQRKFKLILITNHRPIIGESTEAAWRRIKLIPFAITIPTQERDPQLLMKLKAEAPGILNWIIAGCLAQQRDGMQPPSEVLAATNEFKADADPLADFIESRCVVGDFAKVSRAEIWTAYQSWARANGERDPMQRAALYERFRTLDGVADGQWKSDGSPVRGFVGIGLCGTSDTHSESFSGER